MIRVDTLWLSTRPLDMRAGTETILAQVIRRTPVKATDKLPFGVFLAVGLWMTWLYGPLGR